MKNSSPFQKIQLSYLNIEQKIGNSFIQIKPGMLCIFDKDTPSNSRHYHNCFELCVVTEGFGYFWHGEQRYDVRKGDVFIADPDVLHEIAIAQEKEDIQNQRLDVYYFSIAIHTSDFSQAECPEEKILKKFLKNHNIVCSVQNKLISHLHFIYEYSRFKNQVPSILEQCMVNLVMDSLISLTHTHQSSDTNMAPSNIIDEALLYIARHLHEKITLENLANYANTSKRNLQLLFKQHMNSTVTDYINHRRMSVASSYLRMNFRVGDIGPKVGIEDPAQFCRVFKKYYGISPKKYQMTYAADGMTFAADFK